LRQRLVNSSLTGIRVLKKTCSVFI
jgi:hypothetical protein